MGENIFTLYEERYKKKKHVLRFTLNIVLHVCTPSGCRDHMVVGFTHTCTISVYRH